MNLLKYLFYRSLWQRLPVLPRMYSTEYHDVDRDTATLMQMTQTRCPQGVEVLKKRHNARTAQELIATLPARRRKRRPLRRLTNLYRRAMGLSDYDPMKRYARQYSHQRKGRR